MSREENKDDKDVNVLTSKQDVKHQLILLTKIRTQINDRLKELDLWKKKAEVAIDSKQEEVAEFIEQINQDIEEMQNQARDTIDAITESYYSIKEWVGKFYENTIKVVFVAVGIVMALVYGNYFYNNGFDFDVFLTGLFSFPILIISYTVVHNFKSKLDEKFDTSSNLGEAQEKANDFLETQLDLKPTNFEHMKNSLQNFKDVTTKTVSVLIPYVPHVDKYLKSSDRENKQELFRATLRNALVHYGFSPQETINEWVQKFTSLKSTPSEWLDKATSQLSKKLGIPSLFITLIYSDYVGDGTLVKNTWLLIKEEKLLSAFIKMLISNKLVSTTYIDINSDNLASIEALVKDKDSFNLENFRSLYHQFYFDFAKEKTAVISSLRGYRFEISGTIEKIILSFVPTDFNKEKRKNELFEATSKELVTSIEIIQIIYFEHEADTDKRLKYWKKIKNSTEILLKFTKHLIDKKLLSIPTNYVEHVPRQTLNDYVISKFKKLNNFTLSNAEFELDEKFRLVEEKKKYLLRMLAHNNLTIKKEVTREEFNHLLPLNDNEEMLSDWLSSKIKIEKNILLLFYYEYTQDEKEKDVLDKIRENNQTRNLAKILLENSIILKHEASNETTESEIDNLSLLLELGEEFDRRSTQTLFDKCNKIFDYAKSVYGFLEKEKMIRKSKIEFSKVIELVNAQKVQDNLPILKEIVLDCLNNNSIEQFPKEWMTPISYSVLVLLLVEDKDVLQYDACEKSGTDKNAVKILYQTQLIRETDARNAKQATSLNDVVVRVINDDDLLDYTYAPHFQAELKKRILHPNITQLVGKRMEEVYKIINEKQETFRSTFKKIKKQIDQFLESELDYDVVLKSLNLNLVNAYMITSPNSSAPIFGEIIPTYLPIAVADLAKQDSDYIHFLLHSEGTESGKGTRLGIVPINMSFNEFNKKFDVAFKKAVKEYVKKDPRLNEEEYISNLIRIMPSDEFFKIAIGGEKMEDTSSEDHPLNVIGTLIRKYYSPEKNLGLVASLQTGENATINMKNLLIDLVNTRSRIFNYVEDEVKPIIGETPIFESMNSKSFDRQLTQKFSLSHLSDLCSYVYSAQNKGGIKFDSISNKIKTVISNQQKGKRKRITEDQIDQLVLVVIKVLQTWGAIIEGFSDDLIELW